ncbi:hypothetical protein G6F57_015891 [Rhizopus arrhizus]|nr:hypothetical protein G6F31_018684 [Rhizopus arrhizus]KAG1452700.1 hypothetical protein G6F57_015891 [Rhizopus arrhizus]
MASPGAASSVASRGCASGQLNSGSRLQGAGLRKATARLSIQRHERLSTLGGLRTLRQRVPALHVGGRRGRALPSMRRRAPTRQPDGCKSVAGVDPHDSGRIRDRERLPRRTHQPERNA